MNLCTSLLLLLLLVFVLLLVLCCSNSMNQPRSKAELLYDLVLSNGNVEVIKLLLRDGASLEWTDKKGRNALMVACMNRNLIDAARTLIELGANVNAYRPGHHAGTPLHHAAKEGLLQTVKLLLSNGANALVRNDDGQSALDVARQNRHTYVVRAIEKHICYFSGWVREIYGPGFLSYLLSRKIWVVVIPHGPNGHTRPPKLELLVYSTLNDDRLYKVISLWKARIEKPNLSQSDPKLRVFDDSIKSCLKLASAMHGDKQQLQSLHNACRGISQGLFGKSVSEHKNIFASVSSAPSGPLIPEEILVEGPIHYPSIDLDVDASLPLDNEASTSKHKKAENNSSLCVICCEAPLEGACIPCGHMAGCMSCLNEIKAEKGVCPVCRSKMNEVLRIYAV